MSRPTVSNMITTTRELTGSNFIFIPARKHRTYFYFEAEGDIFFWVGRNMPADTSQWWHLQQNRDDALFSNGVYGPIFMVSSGAAQIKFISPLVEQMLIIEGPPTEPEPPVIDVQPTPVTVTEPDPFTFSVEASHPEGAELFYQWQATTESSGAWNTWVNVFSGRESGSDTDTGTVDPSVTTDTGQVRCRVFAYEPGSEYQIDTDHIALTVEAEGRTPVFEDLFDRADGDLSDGPDWGPGWSNDSMFIEDNAMVTGDYSVAEPTRGNLANTLVGWSPTPGTAYEIELECRTPPSGGGIGNVYIGEHASSTAVFTVRLQIYPGEFGVAVDDGLFDPPHMHDLEQGDRIRLRIDNGDVVVYLNDVEVLTNSYTGDDTPDIRIRGQDPIAGGGPPIWEAIRIYEDD